jgi:peptidoglycan hydrolase CwlO-like protein
MTALHYSLQVPDSKITNLLLDMGADASIKNLAGQDSYKLALDLHRKCIYEYEIKNLNKKIKDLELNNRDINNILLSKIESIDYLTKSIDNYREKIKNLEREIILMESDNHQLKEMNTRLKRKNEELNDSIDGLINSKRK